MIQCRHITTLTASIKQALMFLPLNIILGFTWQLNRALAHSTDKTLSPIASNELRILEQVQERN